MNPSIFDDIERNLASSGPAAAVDRLCSALRADKDYHSLFYALLLKKRHELGVSPIPTGPSADLPDTAIAPYEEGIRACGAKSAGSSWKPAICRKPTATSA